jgi:hypothetical protein
MTRLELLERVNELNLQATREDRRDRYWTVPVLYNDVIYCAPKGDASVCKIVEVVGSVDHDA